ncbi:MAG: preprotein translocase subunit YajC [Candidatus Marinimicrobia bacterium]|nr:preprotein translocase subunit YajC [Candidatus Neomarinimicrobiota bacterium]|tara:strand:- start:6843 stop:7142 length:300 start_codon:yes stop_codon:yes gene_type:complete
MMAYLPFILILAIMYFLMIRPQAKRQKEKQEMIKALKKGDKIITIGGIHGTINGFKGKDGGAILLQVDSSTKITINRSSISSLASAGNDEPTEVIESGS